MKKILVVVLAVFLIPEAFPQSNVNEGVNIRFENRQQRGYFNVTQMSMLMGNRQIDHSWHSSDNRNDVQISPSVTMTNGWMFNEQWAAGIGVGFEIFDRNLFPVFADIRYTVWDNRISPFFAVKTGYAFANSREKHHDFLRLDFEPYHVSNAYLRNYGGFMLQPEIGVKIPLSHNADLMLTVAYRHQRTRTNVTQTRELAEWEPNYPGTQFNEWEHKARISRLSFGVAIMFR